MLALTLTSVANVLVTMSLGPLFTALAARLFIGHRIAVRTWVSIIVAGCGIGYMYGSQMMQGVSLVGTLVALCVPISGAANWTVTQHAHAQGHDVDLIPAVLIGAVFSSLLTLPMALPFQASAHDLVLLGGLGLVQLAIPCTLAVLCTRVLQAPEVSLLGLLEVIFGILLAWFGANEVPGSNVLLGGSLVIGALALNELVGWRQRA
jgi:drug/metabolite transporter (DMT)-like permease